MRRGNKYNRFPLETTYDKRNKFKDGVVGS